MAFERQRTGARVRGGPACDACTDGTSANRRQKIRGHDAFHALDDEHRMQEIRASSRGSSVDQWHDYPGRKV